MLDALLAFLVSTFVTGPFEAELAARLAAAQAPQALVAGIGSCASAAVPVLGDLLVADWGWAARQVVGVWIGATTLDAVLAEVVPQCRDAIAAVRPFLARMEAA